MISNLQNKLALFAFLLIITVPQIAHATFIAPKRIMIEDRMPAKAITIFNRTKDTMVYTFDWERRFQHPGGKRDKLKDGDALPPKYMPADEMMIYSPRQVIVKPGESQRLRILARRPADLAPGEYHSHIRIKPAPLQEKIGSKDAQEGFTGTVKVKSYMSIPVFVRHGKTELNIELKNAALTKKDGRDAVKYTLDNSTSTRSFYAKETLKCTQADGTEKSIELGAIRVYVEAGHVEGLSPFPEGSPSADSCASLVLEISALDDFEYKRNQVIQSAKIK